MKTAMLCLLALVALSRAQTMTAASRNGVTLGNAASQNCDVSDDGRFVTFDTAATNLFAQDNNAVSDVYLFDVQTGLTELVSQGTTVNNVVVIGNAASTFGEINDDGDAVAFVSAATNFFVGAPAGITQVYVRDRDDETTTLVSRATGANGAVGTLNSNLPDISDDGELVTFTSAAAELGAPAGGATPFVFVRDLDDDTTSIVSRASGANGAVANGVSAVSRITGNGNYVAFGSQANNLVVGGVISGNGDVYLRDLDDDTTILVSVPAVGGTNTGVSGLPGITLSENGNLVAFTSTSTLIGAADTNGASDIYLRNIENALTSRVSVATGGVEANGASSNPHISGDGRFITFESVATNLVAGDTNGASDIFLHDTQTGVTSRVSTNAMSVQSNGNSNRARISRDASMVCFDSVATNLIANDANAVGDVFLAVGVANVAGAAYF